MIQDKKDRRAPSVIPHSGHPPAFTDRMMWVAIRAHLLAIVSALESVPERTPLIIAGRAALLGIAKAIALRFNIRDRLD